MAHRIGWRGTATGPELTGSGWSTIKVKRLTHFEHRRALLAIAGFTLIFEVCAA
jgi:hypothetical protein